MVENIKAVNNPLTIIAIFAALAEVAGTVALKMVAENLQGTFIWFVMLFPALLVILFFITLNFNPKVLYAPSDFKNEENFLNVIGGVSKLSLSLEDIQAQLETAKIRIVEEATQQIGAAGENERARLEQIVSKQIEVVQERLEATKESANSVSVGIPPGGTNEVIQRRLIDVISSAGGEMLYSQIKEQLDSELARDDIRRNLISLVGQGRLESTTSNKQGAIFRLREK